MKEDEIVCEEREQKNWHKDDSQVEEKYHRLDVSVCRKYKAENLCIAATVLKFSIPLGKSKSVVSDPDAFTVRRKKAALYESFPIRKEKWRMGGWGAISGTRNNWGTTNVMYLCARSSATLSHF